MLLGMLSRGWMHAILSLRRRPCSLPPALHPRRQLIPAGARNGWRSRSLCRLCAWLSWQGGLWAGGTQARGPLPGVHADPSPAELLEQIRNGRGVLEERSRVLRLLLLEMQAAWELGRQPAQRHGGKGTDLPDILNNKRRKKGGKNFLEYFYLFIIPSLPTLTGGRPLLQTCRNRSIIISFENNIYHGVAYDLPRSWGRALSQPILDGFVHPHPQERRRRSAGWRVGAERRQVTVTVLDTSTQGA